MSLYTRPARTTTDKEEWIRKQALLVLVYEAIVSQVLDYDYAPAASNVQGHRVFFNRSQEGAADLDFLREEGLLNGLKLASTQYQPVTCYQISERGLAIARRVPKVDRDVVASFAQAPGTRELLRVQWRADRFILVGPQGFERISTVLDCEDVSYVGSAYIPMCLRFGGRPTLSNAHRAAECALASSNVRDELDEVITLNSVSIVVAEWIPFGANQIVAMNANLGSQERVQGGFFTALVDDDASGTKFVVDPGLTAINVLDYSSAKHINFEVRIPLTSSCLRCWCMSSCNDAPNATNPPGRRTSTFQKQRVLCKWRLSASRLMLTGHFSTACKSRQSWTASKTTFLWTPSRGC